MSAGVTVCLGVHWVDRAFALCHILGRAPGGASVAQLGREAGLRESSARRILVSLAAVGLVLQGPRGDHYGLGSDVPHLADVARGHVLDETVAYLMPRMLRDVIACVRSTGA